MRSCKKYLLLLGLLLMAAVGGQLFAIQTEVPYPQDKSECGKIAKQELAGNERPPLAADLADISQYVKNKQSVF